MNDEFMHEFYEAPRAEFADTLYEKISQQTRPNFVHALEQRLTLRYSVLMILLLFVVAACVYVVMETRWNKVSGIWVHVQKTLTIEAGPPEVISESELGIACLTVEEAREIARFDFQVPTWAPEGFTFDNRVCGINLKTNLNMEFARLSLLWQGPDKDPVIQIMLHNLRWWNVTSQEYEVASASTMPVAPGSYEEVEVNGQPAVLVHGSWEDPWNMQPPPEGKWELKWDKNRGLHLYWVEGEVQYHLQTYAEVSPEDLIKMAESAQ